MLAEFGSNIAKKGLFHKKQKLLLAISGGVDSVVLAYLLKSGGFKFALAHCNFQLRGKDSERDELFCSKLAKKLGVPFFSQRFNVKAYCAEQKTNTQLAARQLRYSWFDELVKKNKFECVLTAHQANDVVETLLINLLRGTGIKGLRGIPEKNGYLVRPLLPFTREEVEHYAKKNKIAFRIDTSNLEDIYERNFIRLNVVPLLKKINPRLEQTLLKNTGNFRQEAAMATDYLQERSTELLTQTHDFLFIDKNKLKRENYQESLLHFMIADFGFNDSQQKSILKNLTTQAISGKRFTSSTHELHISRNDLVIRPLAAGGSAEELNIASLEALKESGLKYKRVKTFRVPSKNELLIQQDRLIFPLTLRAKRKGDKFKPFGMKGFKLVSDFLKDEKLNGFERENCRVLVNGNGDILWVAGLRSDERYRVSANETNLVKISLGK